MATDGETPQPAGLHVTTYGDRGPSIVLCHGLFGQGRNWTQIARSLAADHRVTLVDMPNHGRSAWTDRIDYADLADRVAVLIDGDDPVALVGHSMGGKIAMMLALRHPHLVERLVVVDVAPVAYGSGSEFAGYIAAMQAIDLGALEQRADADAALTDAVPSPTVRGFLLQNLRRDGDSWGWLANLDLLGRELDAIVGWPDDALGETAPYDGPVLWVAGANSAYIGDEHIDAMERWFPRVRRVTVKDAGHWIHAEKPDVFIEILRRFVSRAAGDSGGG